MYERVPARREAALHALSAPVISQVSFPEHISSSHNITNLPRGKYVVCGEASTEGVVYKTGCSEIFVERVKSDSKYRHNKLGLSLAKLKVNKFG